MSHLKQFQHLKIQLEDIQSATNSFSDDNCIGRGGFGRVYKGELVRSSGETAVALKRLDCAFGQGNSEFWKEIMMLSFYKHENIVSLLGYCDDHGEKILMYEYASRKSLDSYLASDDLTWVQRLKICIGAARGLAYLHTPTKSQLRIVHRDIKSSNILLDDNWNAKISDFGLSKFAPANNQFTFLVSNPAGTYGYIDPVYHETGLLTKESDVYSFGVVLFEVLCGRLCFGDMNLPPLIGLVREYYLQHKIRELVYSNIKDQINKTSLELFAKIAYQCVNKERKQRPLMTKILEVLESALDTQEKADAEPKPMTGILNVKVLRTTDFKSKVTVDASNHYLALSIDPEAPSLHNMKKISKYNEVNSEWNEEFNLYVENFLGQILFIHVNNAVSVKKHLHLGIATMKLTELTPEIPLTCSLSAKDDHYRYVGEIQVEVLFKPTDIEDVTGLVQKAPPIGTPKDGGLLVIIIHKGYLLRKKHTHSSVSLLFRGELRKTQTMMNCGMPIWEQEFTFFVERPRMDENLHIEVINNDSWTGLIPWKRSFGCVDISLADVINKKPTHKIYELEQRGFWYTPIRYLFVELHWRTSDDAITATGNDHQQVLYH